MLALLFLCVAAAAQSTSAASSGSFFESVTRALSRIGGKTQDLIAPAFGPIGGSDIVDFTDKTVARRESTRLFQAGTGTVIYVANEFGNIDVIAWQEPVVQIRAEILAGAESFDRAQEIANAIQVDMAASDNRVEVRTVYPDTREMGSVAKTVNCVINAPAAATVECRNSFGDIRITGIQGPIALDCRYGVVELRNIGGPVRARARGELPFRVANLAHGGTFELWRSQAEFRRVSKTLKVLNFFGSIDIAELDGPIDLDATNDSGPIRLILEEDGVPDIQASVFFGSLKSDVPLQPTSSGDLISGRSPNLESNQRLFLTATFGDIEILRRSETDPSVPRLEAQGEYTESIIPEQEAALSEGTEIVIETAPGNLRIEGADEDRLRVSATRVLRMQPGADPRAAAEALDLRLDPREGSVRVVTAARADMQSLGCTYYRVDVAVSCPRTSPVRVSAANGLTAVRGLGESLVVEQAEGRVLVENCKGPLELTVRRGDIQIAECAGPAALTVEQGGVQSRKVYSGQTIAASNGKTVVDSPGGDITVRQRGGDVRILPLDGILGNFDIKAEGSDISILVPESADATILATARNGVIRTAFPLAGEVGKDFQRLQGRPRTDSTGTFQIVLETVGGDIVID